MITPEHPDKGHSILPLHGGYRRLHSFKTAVAVYDATLIFCDRFIDKKSRTHDQMVQAARSGVQNIAEGSVASGTSKKTELKLTNVARASLEELMRDYEDFLRQRMLPVWEKDSPQTMAVRQRMLTHSSNESDGSDLFRTASPEEAANIILCLINQASYLLGRQIRRLEQDFLENGGITERLYSQRTQFREQQDAGKTEVPTCPDCNRPMRLRTASRGPHANQPFWGCSAYPQCTGTRPANSLK